MARARFANLGDGANSMGWAKFAILDQEPTATYDFRKTKITILGKGANFFLGGTSLQFSGWGPTTRGGGGPFAQREGS